MTDAAAPRPATGPACEVVADSPRYRREDGRAVIDVRVTTTDQLFEQHDPAPFPERDLADHTVNYILGALDDIPADERVRIVVTTSAQPKTHPPGEEIVAAIRAHFFHEERRLDRSLRRHYRVGQVSLLVGLTVLGAFLFLAECAAALPAGHFRDIAQQGLTVVGWVAMWRPLEILLYDGWPLVAARRRIRRVLRADVHVRSAALLDPATSSATTPTRTEKP